MDFWLPQQFMQNVKTVTSRIWTWIIKTISRDDNHYAKIPLTQVFQSNTKNFQTDLFEQYMVTLLVQTLRVDLGVMVMKRFLYTLQNTKKGVWPSDSVEYKILD